MIDPCIPAAWAGFEVTLRYRGARYEIAIRNPMSVSRGVATATLDDEDCMAAGGILRVALDRSRRTRTIVATLGAVS